MVSLKSVLLAATLLAHTAQATTISNLVLRDENFNLDKRTFGSISFCPSKGCGNGLYCALGFLCLPCEIGFFSPVGSATCDEAPAGSCVSSKQSAGFDLCLPGLFQDLTGQSSCKTVTAGSYCAGTGNTAPTPADPGCYVPTAKATAPTKAQAGWWASGGSSCTKPTRCSAGTYTPSEGHAAPLPAPGGCYIPSDGATGVIETDPGYFSPGGSSCTTQVVSPIGHYCGGKRNTRPTPAEPGHHCPGTGNSAPIICPINTYQPSSGQADCLPCPSNSQCEEGCTTPTIVSCNPGYFISNKACVICPKGQYCPGSKLPPVNCPAGSYNTLTGQDSLADCLLCSKGTASSAVGATLASTCVSCLAGGFADATGLAACKPCAIGTASNGVGLTVACPTCVGAFFADVTGLKVCKACTTNTGANTAHSTCTAIATGGLHRKRAQECMGGLKSCPVLGGKTGAFECIDTQTNLQSCGGCWSTEGLGGGVDCTTFDNLAEASCVRGKCQYRCPRGYYLTALGCMADSLRSNSTARHGANRMGVQQLSY